MRRRRRKIKRYGRRNSGMKFLGIVGIMILAIVCGYLTARFIIAPFLGYDTDVLKLEFPSKVVETVEKIKPEGNKNDATGYTLQFGAFSTRGAAENLVGKLKKEGISTDIKKIDGKYKVRSPLIESKSKAVEKLKKTKANCVKNIFITKDE